MLKFYEMKTEDLQFMLKACCEVCKRIPYPKIKDSEAYINAMCIQTELIKRDEIFGL